MSQYTPKNEQILGSVLTGSSGEANRTYTLSNNNAVSAMMQVARGEAFLQQGVGYTFDSSTNTITFLTRVWDDQNISIDYFVTEDEVTGDTYCTTLQVARYAGIGVEIYMENLGTGDGTENSYDTSEGNILADSYTIKYGDSGSNSLNTLTETTDYTIDKDSGSILLTSAGVSKVNGKVIYINYVYSPKQSDSVLNSYLDPASREVEKRTNDYFGTSKTSYQYFDNYDSGYPQTDKPFGNQIEPYLEFELRYSNVSSITSVEVLDRVGNVDTTLDSDDYRIITDDTYNDSRLLIDSSIANGKANVKVTYVHGYDSVPKLIQELTALFAGIMALVNISGGSYKDPSTYSLGRKSISLGQIYINVKTTIDELNRRKEQILQQFGQNFGCA